MIDLLLLILMSMSWHLNVASVSGVPLSKIDSHHPALHESLIGNINSSDSHSYELTNCLIESVHLVSLPSTTAKLITSKYNSNLTCVWPPDAFPIPLDHGIREHLSLHRVMASQCTSKVAQFQPSCLHNHDILVHIHSCIIASSLLPEWWPHSASPISCDSHFQVHLELVSSIGCGQSRHSVCKWIAILILRCIVENPN